MGYPRATSVPLLALLAACPPAAADIDPVSGIDLVTITHPGNAPWTGGGTADGRGQVNYEYRIGKYEVTTAQWAEFMNAAFDRPAGDAIPFVQTPFIWGGVNATPTNPSNPNARRWTVPASNEMLPAGGISWRTAAIYCNWLTNGKATNREAFLNGAYDVSTFAYTPSGRFLDQLTHNPGAAYYIPTWDEWIKASHWSPDRFGPDQPGYWTYSNSSESPLVAGPPGVGTANYGFTSPSPYSILLGSYAAVQTPWGLFDTAGATGEWTEEAFYAVPGDPPTDRLFEGSQWGFNAVFADMVRSAGGGEFPSYSGSDVGLRIAASIPSPAGWSVVMGLVTWSTLRRRRSHAESDSGWPGGADMRLQRRNRSGEGTRYQPQWR